MALDLKVSLKGDSPLEEWGVVLYDQRTSQRLSVHNLLDASSFFYRLDRMTLLAASSCPLAWGCSTGMKMFLIPSALKKSVTIDLAN